MMAVGAGGCATYQPRPLPTQASSLSSPAQLAGYDSVTTPLDLDAVARLVLLNHPDLRTQRLRRQAAQAQRAQDSALPNPVLGGSLGFLLSGPGDATAWTASLSEDITALVTLRPRRDAANADADAVDASLLWEQWQVVGKARLLVIDLACIDRQLALQAQITDLLAQRESRLLSALQAGNLDRLSVAPDLAAAAEARSALADLQHRRLDSAQQLNALLGLAPGVALPLSPALPAARVDAVQTREAFDAVKSRRPDLVALQLGYRAQEAKLRAAVLAQFPPLSVGYDASQDNSRVRNGGPAVNVTLPVFDHNQHGVVSARATREQLYQEYVTRLASARDAVDALLAQYAQLTEQRASMSAAQADAVRAATLAQHAQGDGLTDIGHATELRIAALQRELAIAVVEQTMQEDEAALDLLVGRGMPMSLPDEVMAP